MTGLNAGLHAQGAAQGAIDIAGDRESVIGLIAADGTAGVGADVAIDSTVVVAEMGQAALHGHRKGGFLNDVAARRRGRFGQANTSGGNEESTGKDRHDK